MSQPALECRLVVAISAEHKLWHRRSRLTQRHTGRGSSNGDSACSNGSVSKNDSTRTERGCAAQAQRSRRPRVGAHQAPTAAEHRAPSTRIAVSAAGDVRAREVSARSKSNLTLDAHPAAHAGFEPSSRIHARRTQCALRHNNRSEHDNNASRTLATSHDVSTTSTPRPAPPSGTRQIAPGRAT